MPKNLDRIFKATVYLILFAIIATMAIYQVLIANTRIPKDAEGNEIGNLTKKEKDELKNRGTVINVIYSVALLVIGTLYKTLAVKQTEAENWRYQKQYTNKLVDRLFRFNLFNFYFPMLYVGLDTTNPQRLSDVFSNLVT